MAYKKVEMVHGAPTPQPYTYTATMKPDYTKQATMKPDYTKQATMVPNYTNQAVMKPNYIDQAGFTGTKYVYKANNKIQSNLSNYNNPLEMNSLRDVILGSFNPAMNKGSWFAPWNYLVNFTKHYHKHYLEPIFTKGDFQTAMLNVLMGAGEDLDILSNPVKAIVISAYHGDNVGQALLRSTFGDNTGIHNYDYDTGNKITDIVLEFFSDPLTLIEIASGAGAAVKGGSKVAKGVATSTTKEFASESGEKLLKTTSKRLSKSVGKDVTKETIAESAEATLKQLKFKNYIKDGNIWSELVNSKVSGVRKELWNKLLRSNSWDDIAEEYGQDFTKIFANELSTRTGVDQAKILSKLTETGYGRTFTKSINDLVGGAYNASSVGILASIYNKVQFIDDAYTSTIFKAALSPIGVYPAWRIIKSDTVQEALHMQTFRKVQQVEINRNLIASDNAIKKLGKYPGVIQTIDKDLTIRAAFDATNKYLGPQEALDFLGPRLKQNLDGISTILGNKKYSMAAKEQAVLNVLQSYDSYHKIKSIDDFINMLENLQKQIKKVDGVELNTTGLEDYINQFKQLDSLFRNFEYAEEAIKEVNKLSNDIDITAVFKRMQLNGILDNYSTKQILDALDYNEVLRYLGIDQNLINTLRHTNLTGNYKDNINIITKLYYGIQGLKDGIEYYDHTIKYNKNDIDYVQDLLSGIRKNSNNDKVLKENYEKLINTLSSMVSDPKTTLDNNLNYEDYISMFYDNSRRDFTKRDFVITQLQHNKDFVPSETNKFSDTPLAHYIETIDTRYNSLRDVIDNTETALTHYVENPNINIYDKNVLQRIEDLRTIQNTPTRDLIRQQYDLPQVQDLVNKAITDIPLLKSDNILEIDKYFNRLINYCYDNNIHLTENNLIHLGNIQETLTKLNRHINDIKNGDILTFDVLYRNIHNEVQDLMREYNAIKNVFDKANPLNPKTDFRKVLYDTDINTFSRPTKEATYKDIRAYYRTQLMLEPKTWEEFNFNRKQSRKLYEQYLAEDEAWKTSLQQELAEFNIFLKSNHKNLDDILTPEEYKYFMTPDVERYSLSEMMSQISTTLDFGLLEKRVLVSQTSSNINLLQIEKFTQQALLNEDPTLKEMMMTPRIRELVHYISDSEKPVKVLKDLYSKYSDNDKKVLGIFASAFRGKTNYNRLMKEVDYLVKRTPKEYMPEGLNFKQAILTTIINFRTLRARTILNDLDSYTSKFVEGIQGNVNGMDIASIKQNMDTLIKQYDLAPQVEKELKEAGIINTGRHSSVYDTAAQILAWEKINNKRFSGVMLDIETSGLVDPSKNIYGNITDITMMRRDVAGKLEIVYDGKVRLPIDDLKRGYIPQPDALKQMKITENQFVKAHQMLDRPITEEEVLKNFWANLLCLRQKTQIDTFNGSDFDWVFLDKKLTHYRIPEGLTRHDLTRRINNFIFNQEQLRIKPSLSEVLDNLVVEDFYKVIAKDKYTVNSQLVLKFKKLLEEQATRQLDLEKFMPFTGNSPRFISGVDTNFLDSLVQFMKLDDLDYVKPSKLAMEENTAELLSDFIPDEDIEKFLNIRDILKSSGMRDDLFVDSLDPEIKKWLSAVYFSVTNQMSEIGTLNKSWRELPIADSLFDSTRKGYSTTRLMQFQNLIADSLENSGLDISQETINRLRKVPFTNLTQLATVGLQDNLVIGYRKIDMLRLRNFDLNNVDLDILTARKLDDLARKVDANYRSLKNVDILPDYETEIKQMLQQIKDSGIILEAKVIPLNHKNIMYEYSVLETIYRKLMYNTSMGQDTRLASENLLKSLNEKFPTLSSMLQNNSLSTRVSMNGPQMLYSFPDYMNRDYMDYAKIISSRSTNLSAINKIEALIQTSNYPLNEMKRTKLVGEIWKDLSDRVSASYVDGLPTSLTKSYQRVGEETQRVLYAWQTHSVLNLTPEDIRKYVIYANKDHVLNIKRPTNAYFNNQDMFATFATKKEALNELGIKWKYDQDSEILTLSFDTSNPSLKLAVNKNYNKTIYYTLNGEELPSVTLPEINKDDLIYYIIHNNPEDFEEAFDEVTKTKAVNKNIRNYIDTIYTLRERLVAMNPELSGQPGLVNVRDNYIKVRNDPLIPHFNLPKVYNGDDYMPYFNMDMVGELNDVMENTHYFNTDYYETLTSLTNKMLNHSEKHLDYGQFIMEGGLNLNSQAMEKLTTQEIIDMLNTYPELTLVYLKDNPKSLGGFELKKVNAYTPKIIEKAKELNATIVPYNIYATAANTINQYTYGNYATAIWHKVIGLYKRGWLMNIGTIFRNGVDSTMKTFAEGGEVNETMSAYTKAFDLLNKYDKVAREIKQLDPHGRYRLDLAENYFKVKPNALLDKDTYHFIYDFMERSGMNTLSSTVDGMFGVAMKPMSDIERISRFAMYLNLEGQGKSYSEIMRRIAQTHFDYGLKSYSQFLAENYIPFVTYVTNNILYLVHLVEENPSFLKNFFNIYQPIWDFDSYNYNELAENKSLQYQILNGNIPLSMFGYKDKKIKRKINTKNGIREQEVTNTATIRMGSSILDAMQFFINPYYNIKEKLAPPNQLIADTVTEFGQAALGNSSPFEWNTYLETDAKYQRDFGSTSVQALFRDPTNIISLIPYANTFTQRYMHKDLKNNLVLGSTTGERTQNNLLGILSSTFGATNRWGEFKNKEYKYPKKTYGSSGRAYVRTYTPKFKKYYPRPSRVSVRAKIYRPVNYYPRKSIYYSSSKTQPYNNYTKFIYKAAYPNTAHNPSTVYRGNLPKLTSVPQYLHSYNGLTRQGKSKLLSWMRMNTRWKVKTTLRRQARARSLYSRV